MQIEIHHHFRLPDALALPRMAILVLVVTAGPVEAQWNWENPDGRPGTLSRENLSRDHTPHPVDLMGSWLIEGHWSMRPLPRLKPDAQKFFDAVADAAAAGKTVNDVTGECWPPGMPVIMTRVWPIHFIPLKTALVMVFNFGNQVRWVYMDGRKHSDPDITPPSYNGESIGFWEGDTLVVDTRNLETYKHYIDREVPISDQFHIIERIRLSEDGDRLEIEFRMTDPVHWEGEWVSIKTYSRQEYVDYTESPCLPNLNENIPAMADQYRVDIEQ